MDKITFERLDIELTRRCNMACAHCMRGDAQNIDIDRKHIDAILEQTQLIGKLFFTGGEPFLALDTMEYIADQLCKRGIPLLNFEVITNGAYNKDKMPCAKWEAVTNQIVQKNVTKADIQLALNIPEDARDEPTKAEIIETKQKLAKAGNAGILGFFISEMANSVKAQNWKQIASGAQAKDYSQ